MATLLTVNLLYRPRVSRTLASACALPLACLLLASLNSSTASAQPDRQSYLEAEPLAHVAVQTLSAPPAQNYADQPAVMMYQPETEDPLSFYARTQDGEWLIASVVDPKDSWVRILVLGPGKPTIADVSIQINKQPFRAAREHWIDKLLAEAKATFLVRTGAAIAEAAGISADQPVKESDEQSAAAPAEVEVGEDSAAADSVVEDQDVELATTDTNATDTSTTEQSEADETDSEPGEKADGEVGEEAVSEEEADIPMVAAQSRTTSSLFKRLINYLAADQSTAEREEVRWLLAEWTGGPALLTLSPAFAWRRADTAPLWHALDLDGDRQLSSREISQAESTLKQADTNRDEILDIAELIKLGEEHTTHEQTKGYALIVLLDGQTDWNALSRHLAAAYPPSSQMSSESPLMERIGKGDRSVDTAELMNLLSLTPDLVYRVAFESEAAKVELLAAGNGQELNTDNPWKFHSATDQAITIERRETYMELTAAQGEIDEDNASGDMQQTQVAVGAVVDGSPLFRLLDHDNNRQLTMRERHNLQEFLLGLDHNQDGQIDASEVPTAIRLAVTHGPNAHRHLAEPIAAQRKHENGGEAAAPDWFVGMDRNRDGDLSKREFQGSPTQFAKFDRNGDGLISPVEVLETNGNK